MQKQTKPTQPQKSNGSLTELKIKAKELSFQVGF